MDAVDPEVNVAFGREIALAPTRSSVKEWPRPMPRREMKTGLDDFSAIEKTGCDRRSWTREEKLRIVEEAAHPALQPRDRWGLIEIDLQNGARVRVDASVDEKALRCVLSVIKGMA